jgi:hypothetical protein
VCVNLSCYYTEWLAALALAGTRAPRIWFFILATVVAELGAKLLLSGLDSDLLFAVSSALLVAGSVATLVAAQKWLAHPTGETSRAK